MGNALRVSHRCGNDTFIVGSDRYFVPHYNVAQRRLVMTTVAFFILFFLF